MNQFLKHVLVVLILIRIKMKQIQTEANKIHQYYSL